MMEFLQSYTKAIAPHANQRLAKSILLVSINGRLFVVQRKELARRLDHVTAQNVVRWTVQLAIPALAIVSALNV